MKTILTFASWIYGALAGLRNRLFEAGLLRTYTSSLPVISVGNVTAGGNGKTPLVIFLVEELGRKGYKPVVLSRGYGGSERGPRLVSDEDPAARVGDEPLLITRKTAVPVVVSRRRVAGAKFIEEQKLGNLIILDDGFQHRWLNRDVDIISINSGTREAREAFIAGKLLPLGRFREARDAALRRAHICIFAARKPGTLQSEEDQALFRLIPAGVQMYRSCFEPVGVFPCLEGKPLPNGPVIACCGIAHPEGFLQTLEGLGYSPANSYAFPDHHEFTSGDIENISRHHPGLPIVCTEKDAIRLPDEVKKGLYELRIKTKVLPGDAFITNLTRVLLQREQRMRRSVIDLHTAAADKTITK